MNNGRLSDCRPEDWKRFTVDVKRLAIEHIIPQLVALTIKPLLSNISLIVNGYIKVGLCHKVEVCVSNELLNYVGLMRGLIVLF